MIKKPVIIKAASAKLPTLYGTFKIFIYKSTDCREHVALILGKAPGKIVLTRIHSQCLTGDTFFSLKCDCGDQLKISLEKIQKTGSGILIYLNQEGRGIGLINKIKAYALQEKGHDTVEANKTLGLAVDARDYKIAAYILKDLGILRINLLTNNPDKIKQLKKYGIEIAKTTSLEISPNNINHSYLLTKKDKLGHLLK